MNSDTSDNYSPRPGQSPFRPPVSKLSEAPQEPRHRLESILRSPLVQSLLKQVGVKYVEISIDSLNPEEHDRFRRKRGAWHRATEGIPNTVAVGIKTGLATCFTRSNVSTAADVIRFAKDLGLRPFRPSFGSQPERRSLPRM
jgi:sulfatase maturation enzyme AslB (radical SAM superfamily)